MLSNGCKGSSTEENLGEERVNSMRSLANRSLAALGLRPPVIDRPDPGFVLRDVTVVNPGDGCKQGRTLVAEDSKITRISEVASADSGDQGASPYSGYFALPGLIDMHVHYPVLPSRFVPPTFDLSEWSGPLYLRFGVTTVRDVGSFDTIWDLRRRMNDHEFPCPRMFCAGPLLDGDPPRMADLSWIVRNPREAQDAVEKLADKGADFIKVYDNLTPESLAAIREAAAGRGLAVVGHLPFLVKFEEAGIHDLQHVWGIQLPSLQPGLDFNNPADFSKFMRAWVELDDDRIKEIVRISVEEGVVHTPTIVTVARIAGMNDPGQTKDPLCLLLPRYFRDLLWNPEVGVPYLQGHSADEMQEIAAAVARMKEVVGRLHQEGVRILTGSDGPPNPFCVPGASIHEELQHLVDSGFTPEEAWLAGTRHAGEFLGMPLLGTLREDAPADVLVFREDPTRDLSALSTLEAVAVQGRLYTRQMLDQAVARHRKYFDGWLYDRVTTSLVRSVLEKL